ncbi:MAG: Na+/H+ antiporter NhaA [Steroidobacteraceae bacterium]
MTRRTRAPALRFAQFLQVEAASGLVLLAAAAIALIWANSPAAGAYQTFWQVPLHFSAGALHLAEPLRFWVDDALMAFFFLLVGLEIRRELHEGTLANIKLAVLPMLAALGGVLVPALIYAFFNRSSPLWRGWAVPTATDIAFAVGVLSLLGKRVPTSLRVLLLAIAIIDDIIAILVIALFYSHGLGTAGLVIAGLATAVLAALQIGRRRAIVLSVILGILIWSGLRSAGVNPALSGVIMGTLTPIAAARRAERALHPWVAFGIMPLFALANAGVNLGAVNLHTNMTLFLIAGVASGLVIGKPLGIFLATALAVRLGWCALPPGVDFKHVGVIGCLAGIGFTMSIFISHLTFEEAGQLATAKVAILVGSTLAAVLGLVVGRLWLSDSPSSPSYVR